ncbi:Sulfate transporter/antisigma-factor antagonist STAS [Caldithrix abyssi DSM 13497]|uniref:Anti-anti-sigma factor n=1 Tax=Caldithrix abyssi DSM 13497 TaxID=880073 RepID=H1XQ87_CALAY|nr:STAS domain-containing protein [Caldithrix abyssi]APF19506.1 anti-anti-sigma factor [Caldithrix abyssi DSM 13497]EHO43392.1 Sulfate transporter/antisigma-factor antagonist STAS [Caldithrix abyssi DSM 13497]
MESNFKLTSVLKGDILIITTEGYVNNQGGEMILTTFNDYFQKGVKKVVINFKRSNLVNSIGISFLIEIIEQLNHVQGKLIFTDLEPAIEKTLTIMGLFNFAGQAATVKSALHNF